MKKAIITGAGGFIGLKVIERFSALYEIYAIDINQIKSNNSSVRISNSPIQNKLLKTFAGEVDVIIHCAGSSTVGFSYQYPYNDFQNNVNSLLEVLEYVRLFSPNTKIIFLSSGAVYGVKSNLPMKENDTTNPVSPYGYHKKIAEDLCLSYHKNYGINIAIVRFFSIYGVGLRKQLFWEACMKFKNFSDGKINFYGKGTEIRDWLNVDDAVNLIETLSQHQSGFDIFNGGTGVESKNNQVLNLLAKTYNENIEIVFNGETREGDPDYYCAETTKVSNLNWKPLIYINDGIDEYVRWFKTL